MTGRSVAAYERLRDLRLRPALDLLARVPETPEGPVADLGCGDGAAAEALRDRFPEARLIGVDSSPEMLGRARARGAHDALIRADIADVGGWAPAGAAPALVFSNAALHWLEGREALIPRLMGLLAPGGALAAQMPDQLDRPSHQTMIAAAASVRPDLFADWRPFPGPLPLAAYAELAAGEADLWETEYRQRLAAVEEGHPARAFSGATAARPALARLDEAERAAFLAAWDTALEGGCPPLLDGGCRFPFRRLFMVIRKSAWRRRRRRFANPSAIG